MPTLADRRAEHLTLRPLANCVARAHAGRKALPLIKLVDDFSASFSYVANDGPRFVFTTNLNAPRYK